MNEMYLRFPGGRKKAFTISYDDNTTQDERLIELMKQYNIKGTFNIIPNWFLPRRGDLYQCYREESAGAL